MSIIFTKSNKKLNSNKITIDILFFINDSKIYYFELLKKAVDVILKVSIISRREQIDDSW